MYSPPTYSPAAWAAFLQERRASFASATSADRDSLFASFDLVLDRIADLRALSETYAHVYSPELSFLAVPPSLDGIAQRFVWGREQAVEEDWQDMPRYRGWRISTLLTEGPITLSTHADDPADLDFVPGGPWALPLDVFPLVPSSPVAAETFLHLIHLGLSSAEALVPALALSPVQLETFLTLLRDGLAPSKASALARTLHP